MGLISALGAANAGLRATQAGIDVVSQNVANADTVGYVRRRLNPVTTGTPVPGVRTGVERVLDAVMQKQLRLETAGAAYTSLMARVAADVDRLFGPPGNASSLDGRVNAFTTALQDLLADPSSYSARSAVLDAGTALAARIGAAAEGIQALRSEAEQRLSLGVNRANELLAGIADVNARIVAQGTLGIVPALHDQRDRMVAELATLMDVQTSQGSNGSITLTTASGLMLFNGSVPMKLTFDGRGTIGANAVWSADDAERGVGTIKVVTPSGGSMDVVASGLIRSGEIAAALELRDRTLVAAQRQLDELAAGFARALSDRSVAGTPASAGGSSGFDIDLAGLQPGNAVTLDYRDNAVVPPATRRIVLIPTLGGAPATLDPMQAGHPGASVRTLDISGGPGALAAALGAALGPGFAVTANADGSLRILDDGSAGAPTPLAVQASITVTGFAGGHPQLPFFVDAGHGNAAFTGSFEGGSHLAGFAQRMAVNPALFADRSRLVVSAPGTPQGDGARPQHLLDSLTRSSWTFSAATGIGGISAPYESTVATFAQRIVETHGANAESAARLHEGQRITLANIEGRFAEYSRVDIDEEMAHLISLQTTYAASARIMTAVRDLLDTLLRL